MSNENCNIIRQRKQFKLSGETEFILEVVDDGHVVSFDPVFEERHYVSNRNMIGGRIRR